MAQQQNIFTAQLPAGTRIGGCVLKEKIGEGGMGIVYKAHHQTLDIPVAVKILRPDSLDKNAVERFLREARTAARLRHPSIVQVLDAGQQDGLNFIVMEYVNGSSVRDLITSKGSLPFENTLRIVMQIVAALDAAAKAGIVHRDIKPENIIIDTNNVARLVDLGLARSLHDPALTQTSTTLGSPHYIAPEQAQSPQTADIRADIYSLGCTMYHMLCGKPPFEGGSAVQLILDHVRTPSPVLKLTKDIPEGFPESLAKMMAKDPEERFKSPQEVAAALENFVNGGSVKHSTAMQNIMQENPAGLTRQKLFRLWAIGLMLCLVLAGMVVYFYTSAGRYANSRQSSTSSGSNARDSSSDAPVETAPSAKDKIDTSARRAPAINRKPAIAPVPAIQSTPSKLVANDAPLIKAAKTGDVQALQGMLDNGALPDVRGKNGATPLIEAVKLGDTDNTRRLLDKGANPNIPDGSGMTPLHYAIQDDAQFIVRLLLDRGANPNQTDAKGRTPLDIAHDFAGPTIEQILIERGAR